MKFNRSMLGGTIKKTALEPYSRYIGKYLDGYAAEGVPFNAVTVQNEVDTTVDGRYPACLWSQEDEILFVGRYLGPLLRKANSPTKIWILDHNFNLWGRAIAELSDPGVYEYADGIAWHGYAGVPSGMSMAHNAFPEKNAYFTEGGPGRGPGGPSGGPTSAWTRWVEWANDCFSNWAKSITVWNIALDEHGTPYIGRRETPPPGAAGAGGRGGAAGAGAAGGRGGAAGAAGGCRTWRSRRSWRGWRAWRSCRSCRTRRCVWRWRRGWHDHDPKRYACGIARRGVLVACALLETRAARSQGLPHRWNGRQRDAKLQEPRLACRIHQSGWEHGGGALQSRSGEAHSVSFWEGTLWISIYRPIPVYTLQWS